MSFTVKSLITNRDFSPELIFTEIDSNLSSASSPSPSVLTPPADYADSTVVDFDISKSLTPSLSSDRLTDVVDPASGLPLGPVSPLDLGEPDYGRPSSSLMSLYVELLSLELPMGSTAQLGLDADITDHGVDVILSLNAQDSTGGLNTPFNARKLSDVPSQSLFCQAPQLIIVSPLLSPHKTYFGTFGVYLDATKPVHSEVANLTVGLAPVDCPSGPFVWRAPIIPGYWEELGSSPCTCLWYS